MRQLIPAQILAVVSDITARRETHATMDNLFTYAGAPGEPPEGNKQAKSLAWLRRVNKDPSTDPIVVLGRLIEGYMELAPNYFLAQNQTEDQERIKRVLADNNLQYVKGGKIVGALCAPSKTLEEFIRDRDINSINEEFDRALSNVETNPREAVSAASNILESVCKVYIADENLTAPAKQDLKQVWSVVRKHLGFDPSTVEDQDLQQILSGMISVVEGIGALRTHASSAHGAGKKSYKLEPRHSRLAVHSAHTLVLFILESWKKRKGLEVHIND